MAARRTSAAGTPAALATASAITPTSAPWRNSPPSRRRRNVCSSRWPTRTVALSSSARRAWEPLPATRPISVNASCDAAHRERRLLGGAGAWPAARPTPRRSGAVAARRTATRPRRRRALDRPRLRRGSAALRCGRSWPERAETAPTSADVVATSTSSTRPAWHVGRTSRRSDADSCRVLTVTSKDTVCQPVAPSGTTSAWSEVCTAPVPSVARTAIGVTQDRRPATRSSTAARCPWSSSRRVGPAAKAPSSILTSTALTPRCCAHATPPNVTGPLATTCPLLGTSMRDSVLMGPRGRPAEPGPVRLGAIEAGELQVDDPLGRRHVAVEARHDQARRVAVLDGQRSAVHPDRQEGVALIGERLDRRARGEPVDRRRQHHVGVGVNARPGQQVSNPVPRPLGVRDQVAADGIGHAGQRHDLLDGVEPLQVVEACSVTSRSTMPWIRRRQSARLS